MIQVQQTLQASSILSDNIEVLNVKYPELVRRLASVCLDGYELVVIQDRVYDLRINGNLFYEGDPFGYLKKSLTTSSFIYPRMVMGYGIGLGYHLPEFLKKFGKISRHILLVEKSLEIFYFSLSVMDWRPLLADDRITLFVGIAEADLKDELQNYLFSDDRGVSIKTASNLFDHAAVRLSEEYYAHLFKVYQEAVIDFDNVVRASPEDVYRGFMNIIENLPQSSGVPLFDSLENTFQGFVGISVAAGPSLKYSLKWLKEVQDRAVIITTDVSLRILLENGIVPHFVSCIERVPETSLFFQDIPELPDSWLIGTPVIWPETYLSYPGPKIHMIRGIGQLLYFFPKAKYYDTGISAAHINVVALQKMGCSRILMVGQDLAFDRYSEATHADGLPKLIADYESKERAQAQSDAEQNKNGVMVEGNDDCPILTTPLYNKFRTYFEYLIKHFSPTCYNVIPKNYGAKIFGANWLDPNEALNLLREKRPVTQMIRLGLQKQDLPGDDDFRKQLHDSYQYAIDRLEEYREISLEVLDVTSQFRLRYDPLIYEAEIYQPIFQRIESIVDDIFTVDDFFMKFVMAQVQDRCVAIAQCAEQLLVKHQKPNVDCIESQFSIILEWFEVVHFWSTRMARYLRKRLI